MESDPDHDLLEDANHLMEKSNNQLTICAQARRLHCKENKCSCMDGTVYNELTSTCQESQVRRHSKYIHLKLLL